MLNQTRTLLDLNEFRKFLQQARWFGGKNRIVKNISIQDWIEPAPSKIGKGNWTILLLKVEYGTVECEAEGMETYLLPIAELSDAEAQGLVINSPSAILSQGENLHSDGNIICDAIYSNEFRSDFLNALTNEFELIGSHGKIKLMLSAKTETEFKELAERFLLGENNSQVLKTEQSNSALIYPDRFFLKLIRRCEAGINPDMEILQYLTEKTAFKNVPKFYGSIKYQENESGKEYAIGLIQNLVHHQQDGWGYALDLARKAFAENFVPNVPALEFASTLGKRTAEMHLALAAEKKDIDFVPEKFSSEDKAELLQKFQLQLEKVMVGLNEALPHLTPATKLLADEMLALKPAFHKFISEMADSQFDSMKIRVHGDYHLGQVLWTGKDVVILDFEGEPAKSLIERRKKFSPWKDVAGMIRSFHYAIYSIGSEINAESWHQSMKERFLNSYTHGLQGTELLPTEEIQVKLLQFFLIDKAIYELEYELNNRPTWVHIPLFGILSLMRN